MTSVTARCLVARVVGEWFSGAVGAVDRQRIGQGCDLGDARYCWRSAAAVSWVTACSTMALGAAMVMRAKPAPSRPNQ